MLAMISAKDVVRVQLTKEPSVLPKMLIAENVKRKITSKPSAYRGKVNTVVDDDSTYSLGSDEIDSLHTDPWKTSVSINGNSVEFELDAGANVSVVPDFIIPKLNATIQNSKRTLTGRDGSKLEVAGVISATLKANHLESNQEIFVVRNLKTALLGRPAIEALNLVKVVNAVEESYQEYVQARHLKLFKGLGKLDGKYHIQLKDNAVPYEVNTPR